MVLNIIFLEEACLKLTLDTHFIRYPEISIRLIHVMTSRYLLKKLPIPTPDFTHFGIRGCMEMN